MLSCELLLDQTEDDQSIFNFAVVLYRKSLVANQ